MVIQIFCIKWNVLCAHGESVFLRNCACFIYFATSSGPGEAVGKTDINFKSRITNDVFELRRTAENETMSKLYMSPMIRAVGQ